MSSIVTPLPPTPIEPVSAVAAGGKHLSPNQRAWARFKRNRLGYLSLWAFVALLLIANRRLGLSTGLEDICSLVLEQPYFEEVERDAAALLARRLDVLERIIGGSCRLKASVIERDPEEKSDLRFALNYGHTIGHALEAVTGYGRWTHGEAVSLGIAAEARLARRLTLADEATVARQERLLAGLGLPIHVGAIDVEAVLSAMTRDKKARDGRVPFVLAPRLGEFRVVYDVPVAEIRSALREVTS